MRQIRIPCIMAAGYIAMSAALASAQTWRPATNVEIVVASGAGGASDRTARLLQKLLGQTALFQTISVANRPGGGGTVAWTYLSQRTADPHNVATFSSTMLTNHALGVGKLSYRDFTPISILRRPFLPRKGDG
jgi:putative tricarboxylic transport membrane protein